MLNASTITPYVGNEAGGRADCDFVPAVLDIIRARTGVDFGCYRTAMLERRIANHFASVGAADEAQYLELLRTSASEPVRLLERITIKVSRFYRYAPAFDHLRDIVLPGLARARCGEPLHIWVAGCGAGEEAYTFAMLLEHAGIEGVIEASDVDATALAAAQAGIYPLTAAAELPASLLIEYLEPVVRHGQPHYRVQDNLRTRVRFSRHDLTAGTPAPGGGKEFDLVSCRNVLIYLQRQAQANATRRLLDVIRENGLVCLGEAEWPPPELQESLEALSHKTRLFRLRAPKPFTEDPFAEHNEINRAHLRAASRVASGSLGAVADTATRTMLRQKS